MTVMLPLTAIPAEQTMATSRSRLAVPGWLAAARQFLLHLPAALRTRMRVANEPRLTPAMKRDIGLLPEEHIDAPIRGIGEVLWRF